jgi:hypothetical protein
MDKAAFLVWFAVTVGMAFVGALALLAVMP